MKQSDCEDAQSDDGDIQYEEEVREPEQVVGRYRARSCSFYFQEEEVRDNSTTEIVQKITNQTTVNLSLRDRYPLYSIAEEVLPLDVNDEVETALVVEGGAITAFSGALSSLHK